jgi:hypothetical protein
VRLCSSAKSARKWRRKMRRRRRPPFYKKWKIKTGKEDKDFGITNAHSKYTSAAAIRLRTVGRSSCCPSERDRWRGGSQAPYPPAGLTLWAHLTPYLPLCRARVAMCCQVGSSSGRAACKIAG